MPLHIADGERMIYGIGIDLVENERLAGIIERWGSKFLQRIFSAEEIDYCSRHAQAAMHYAARFAAKESFLKALGLGLGMGVRLREIEVVHDDNGKPALVLLGAARVMIEERRIVRKYLSLTHTKRYASAIVILEKK
jgi:holo-[acyl-carrier protein] synthase